jgi:CheY-like chemotaxis protein
MLDAVAMGAVALTYVGAQVAHKAANGAIQAVWDKFSERFGDIFKRPPSPSDPLQDAQAVIAQDAELANSIAGVLNDSSALRRARLAAAAIRGARILWIDDQPANNAWERRMLRELGAHVTAVTQTATALDCLGAEPFDVVLSDIARRDRRDEGLISLPQINAVAPRTAVIFYVGALDAKRGIPPGARGITDHPEELLHMALDALERRKL